MELLLVLIAVMLVAAVLAAAGAFSRRRTVAVRRARPVATEQVVERRVE